MKQKHHIEPLPRACFSSRVRVCVAIGRTTYQIGGFRMFYMLSFVQNRCVRRRISAIGQRAITHKESEIHGLLTVSSSFAATSRLVGRAFHMSQSIEWAFGLSCQDVRAKTISVSDVASPAQSLRAFKAERLHEGMSEGRRALRDFCNYLRDSFVSSLLVNTHHLILYTLAPDPFLRSLNACQLFNPISTGPCATTGVWRPFVDTVPSSQERIAFGSMTSFNE